MNTTHCAWLLIALGAAQTCAATTYQVGPGRTYATLTAAFSAVDLNGGDVVEVYASPSAYAGGIVMPNADSGSLGNPVILRGMRVNGLRPVIAGGVNSIEFRQSNYVVFEGFEVTGGTSRCIFQSANDVTVRDSVIHDCPAHGILSSDQLSGSFTLEYSELYNCGSGSTQHSLYIQSDEIAWPGSVFRMRYNYVHNGNGGNLLKSRHERSEIAYNWFEGSVYHELELIGPDENTQQNGWTRDLVREDADVIGNVIIHTNQAFGSVIRVGGDGTGQSKGRARFVNNTILVASGQDSTIFRIFDGIQSVEMHNNVIDVTAGGVPRIERTVEAVWTNGRQIRGSNNWIESGASFVPTTTEWTGTLSGSSPGFVSLAAFDLTPLAASPLRDAANPAPATSPTYPFSGPAFPPLFHPARQITAPGSAAARSLDAALDIGAFESATDLIFRYGFQP
ncbi:MAG: hypothetical protein ABI411_11425 [Tahibacter sp.]